MPLRRFSPGLKAQFAFGMVFLFVQPDASAADISAQQIGGVIIPQAFSQALQDGMSVPLYIHLAGSQGRQDDQRIGSAFIWLDDGQLRIRKIQLEESEDNASVSEQTRQQLMALANAPFNEALTIPLTDNAQLDLSLRQLLLQLVVKREALGTVLRSRSEDIGQSSVNTLSSNLSYNFGVYNNQLRNGGSNTSSYLSLNNVTALREHHVVLDGSLYGIGSGQQDSELYKAMYERDFAGHRFAGGMLDTWNLQSLGPMTAISAGKIYGLSWGNQASSTIFDSSQSATPVIAFLPAAGEGNADCRTQTIGSRSGLSCKMVNYTLQTNGLSNTSIHIFPAIANSSLASAVGAYDMQFSLNGSSWKPVSNTAYYYTFNEMKSADSIYVFFSSNFFKQMVNLGISDINTKDLFNFRFQNTTSPESGWYEFSTSNTLIIKPRDFSISIISDEYTQTPSREGYVGSGESALDFGYIVTTSGKTAADEVLIKVTGPAQVIGGRSYCVFSSDDGKAKVPFPATLSFITRNGATKTYDAGCDDSWRDMTDALWLTTPWTDISGEVGQMDKTTVKFSIPMDNAISLRTVDDNGWFGEVSASGEIHVQATWRNIN